MFVKNKNYDNFIQKVKVNIGLLLNLEQDEDAFITLKELPTLEMIKLKDASAKGENETLMIFKELLPVIITDHNLYESEDKKMKNDAVAALIFESVELTLKIVDSYTKAAFFSQVKKKE